MTPHELEGLTKFVAHERKVTLAKRVTKLCAPLLVVGVLWLVVGRTATLCVVGGIAVVGLAFRILVTNAREAQHRDMWIAPAAEVLAEWMPTTGFSTLDNTRRADIADDIVGSPTKYIVLPRDFPIEPADVKSFVRINVPVSISSWTKARVSEFEGKLAGRLGLGDTPTVEYTYTGRRTVMHMWPTPKFDRVFTLADVLPFIESNNDPMRVLLGLSITGEPVWYDHVANGPHLKVSAGSGAGKSTLYRMLLPQYIRNGAQVIVLDVKGVSQLGLATAIGFKNLRYYSEAQTCHDALQAVFTEVSRRRLAYIQAKLSGETVTFPPVHVVLEEANTLMAMLRDFWEYAKQAHAEAAKHSPAIRAMHYSVFMGREFGVFMHVVAQRAEAQTFGGGAVRENFNSALMSKWDTRTWKMLAHNHKYVAHPGDFSWYHVNSAEVVRYLPPNLDDASAAGVAGDLSTIADVEWSPELLAIADVRDVAAGVSTENAITSGATLALEGPAEFVTLAEIRPMLVTHGFADLDTQALPKFARNERQRPGFGPFPPSVDKCGPNGAARWRRVDVLEWLANSTVEPDGKYWDGGQWHRIKRDDLAVVPRDVYGLTVAGVINDYIGSTNNVDRRYGEHCDNQPWRDYIEGYEVLWSGVCTALEVRQVEAQAMTVVRPKLNASLPMSNGEYVNEYGVRDARHRELGVK